MHPREFENQGALYEYAEAHDLAFVWEGGTQFTKRWRLAQLSRPGEYRLVEVRTKRRITKALLFPKAILRAEFEAKAPFREAVEIKRERLRAKKAAKRNRPTESGDGTLRDALAKVADAFAVKPLNFGSPPRALVLSRRPAHIQGESEPGGASWR